MAEDPKVKKGEPGVDEQLPQGGATELNEGFAEADRLAAEEKAAVSEGGPAPAEPLPEEPMPALADEGDLDADDGGIDEEMDFLTSTDRPGNRRIERGLPLVPLSVVRRLPRLKAAATSPGASPQVVAMYRLIVNRLQEEEGATQPTPRA
jgi:hypothetical protein